METSDLFTCDVSFKSSVETVINGVRGLLCKGYASLYGRTDSVGDVQLPGAFADAAESMWGRQPQPPILWAHGLSDIGTRPIGFATSYSVDDTGLYVESFIPAEPSFTDGRLVHLFKSIYDGIKRGTVNGYSVGGIAVGIGKALHQWHLTEVSMTPTPCLPSARFVVGTKALVDTYGQVPPSLLSAQDTAGAMTVPPTTATHGAGILSRPDFSKVMQIAQRNNDVALHDHLTNRPIETHGAHDAQTCTICTDRRSSMGMKASVSSAGAPAVAAAQALLATYTAAVKAGKRHSAATRAKVQTVIDLLNELIAEEATEHDPEDEVPAGSAT